MCRVPRSIALAVVGLAALAPAGCASSGEPALWALPDTAALGASTQTFEIEVHRVECASGVTGEVLPLDVEEGEVQVVVTATVARNESGDASCPGNEPVLVSVELDQPLGDRELVDGGCERYALDDLTDCVTSVRWSP